MAGASLIGLGYDTDTEDEDEDGEQGIASPAREASDSSDEDTFEQRIAQKKKEFERKMSRLEECESGMYIAAFGLVNVDIACHHFFCVTLMQKFVI
jgi:hypothetical protein